LALNVARSYPLTCGNEVSTVLIVARRVPLLLDSTRTQTGLLEINE
jgi:hypothetical protein